MNSHRKRKNRSKGRSKSKGRSESKSEPGDFFEIKTSNIMGRYLVSCKNFEPGEIIMEEEPLVVGPCAGSKILCLGCYKPLENLQEICKCKKCQWPLCNAKCPGLGTRYGHDDIECATLSQIRVEYEDLDKLALSYNAIVPLRCLLLKQIDPEGYETLIKMEAHNKIREAIQELWMNNQTLVVDRIINDWELEYTAEEIHNICGILEVNSFEIGQGISIRGLYPRAFLLSHDCVPNTNHTDEETSYKLTVRASTKIHQGQPITLSYAYTLQSTLKRREHLLENKFFECKCQRCRDPSELNTFTGALICPKCGGSVLSTNPLDQEAHWCCTLCCAYQLSAVSMHLLLERIAQEADAIDCNDVLGMESFLSKYRNVLQPTHYLNIGVKLSLSQVYGKIPGFLIDELSDEQLLRKKAICEEILEVFDVIEPGYTRIRGVTLYELHAPLMILLHRQFARREISKRELRGRLRRVVECLEEAAFILGEESKSSNEGLMGLAASDALIKIKEWEKILGKL